MITHRITVSMPRLVAFAAGAAFIVCAGSAVAQGKKPLAGQVVKMAWIDPLSGLMAPVGTNQLKSAQFFAEKFSATNPAGVKFEVVGMDNKLSPTESLNALKAATDQGVRYIIQGNGSSVALALVDAINKYNERNPGKEVVYMNEAAVDPDLTNSKCSFWQFRLDADTTMKMEAMTTFIKESQASRISTTSSSPRQTWDPSGRWRSRSAVALSTTSHPSRSAAATASSKLDTYSRSHRVIP